MCQSRTARSSSRVEDDVRIVYGRSSSHPVEYAITLRVIADGSWHTIVDDASQCYFTPSSRLRRRVDRLCGRIRVRVEERPAQGPSRSWHAVRSREAFERELVPGGLLPA